MQKQVSLFASVVMLAVAHAVIAQPPPPPSWSLDAEDTTPSVNYTGTQSGYGTANVITGTATSSHSSDPSAPNRTTATSMIKTTFPAGQVSGNGTYTASTQYRRTFTWTYDPVVYPPPAVYLTHNYQYQGDLIATVIGSGSANPETLFSASLNYQDDAHQTHYSSSNLHDGHSNPVTSNQSYDVPIASTSGSLSYDSYISGNDTLSITALTSVSVDSQITATQYDNSSVTAQSGDNTINALTPSVSTNPPPFP